MHTSISLLLSLWFFFGHRKTVTPSPYSALGLRASELSRSSSSRTRPVSTIYIFILFRFLRQTNSLFSLHAIARPNYRSATEAVRDKCFRLFNEVRTRLTVVFAVLLFNTGIQSIEFNSVNLVSAIQGLLYKTPVRSCTVRIRGL